MMRAELRSCVVQQATDRPPCAGIGGRIRLTDCPATLICAPEGDMSTLVLYVRKSSAGCAIFCVDSHICCFLQVTHLRNDG